jgi:hypothetical protein
MPGSVQHGEQCLQRQEVQRLCSEEVRRLRR